MTDIWDEKPDLFVEIGVHEDIVHIADMTIITEEGDDYLNEFKKFDAWLEKLKEEIVTAWTKDENRLTKVIVERGRKLEAIKKLKDEYKAANTDTSKPYGFVLKHIVANLENILESSEFKENDQGCSEEATKNA